MRLFVAIYPPLASAESLLDDLRLVGHRGCREARPEQVHLTLQFIGERHKGELDDVTLSIERSAAGIGAFELTPLRLITLPKRGRPRLVAAETDAPPELLELLRRLAQRLVRRPRARPADRFTPHMTLCRFANQARSPSVDAEVDAGPFRVDVIKLMRSVLLPEGARHDEVHTAMLGARGPR